MPTKTPRAKAASATTGTNKTNPALLKPLQPSKELAAVVGPDPLPRGQAVKKVWDYIKKQNLQNPENRREILADDKLSPIAGKDKVTMLRRARERPKPFPDYLILLRLNGRRRIISKASRPTCRSRPRSGGRRGG